MKKVIMALACVAAMVSCSDNGAKKDSELQSQRDSLNSIIEQRDREIDDMLGTFNEIEEGFREINEAEGRVNIAKQGEGASREQRMKENMEFIKSTMKQNRELIAKLRQQLKDSSYKGKQFETAVENLTKQLEEKDAQVKALQAELEAKNIHIAELDEQISGLNTDVSSLQQENTQQSNTISTQDKQLNTAWYVFGTKKELEEQNILADGKKKNVLKENFNQDYFTKIDIRETKVINFYSRSAEMLTTHPSDSYSLDKDANKQYVLTITNPKKFWSTSKYLVVLVK